MSAEHVCNMRDVWPTGHPLPPEDTAKLEGPEVGQFCYYERKRGGERVVVRVIERSYVWSPGECRAKGGYRHYDWKVIEEGPDKYRAVVVNDENLIPILTDRVVTAYKVVIR